VLRECWRLGLKTRDDMERAVSVRWSRPSAPPTGRHLSRDDRQRLLGACGDSDRGMRDRAIVRLMLLGLRRAEVAMVKVGDVSFSEGIVRVEGKGRRRREVPMGSRTASDLQMYIACRGQAEGRLILPHRDGVFSPCESGISVRAINKIIAIISSKSGVKFTPHDMRRSAIGDWLGTVDVGIAMRMAGHSNPQTTMRYDHRNVNSLGRAAAAASEV
jgi:integrase